MGQTNIMKFRYSINLNIHISLPVAYDKKKMYYSFHTVCWNPNKPKETDKFYSKISVRFFKYLITGFGRIFAQTFSKGFWFQNQFFRYGSNPCGQIVCWFQLLQLKLFTIIIKMINNIQQFSVK